MGIPSTQDIATGYDQVPESAGARYAHELWISHPRSGVITALVNAYPLMRKASSRNRVLFSLLPFARIDREILELAMRALEDKSYVVRQEACAALAYALDSSAIPCLSKALAHADLKTRADASAAIEAIDSQDPNRYVDRAGDGSVTWQVPGVERI